MGKRILAQRSGRGGIQYRAPKKGKIAPARYPFFSPDSTAKGMVEEILHERGRGAPLAKVRFEDGRIAYLPAVEGLSANSRIKIGPEAGLKPGNVLPLSRIPEGSSICNIELNFGDGGKLVRSSGGSAVLFAQVPGGSVIRMPSGRTVTALSNCRATIGKISGGGRLERPFLMAGRRFRAFRAKGKIYPRGVRGVAMAAVYHPFGGGRHQHPGKSTSTSRNAPPGRKVGHIAPRKTGRKRIEKKYAR